MHSKLNWTEYLKPIGNESSNEKSVLDDIANVVDTA